MTVGVYAFVTPDYEKRGYPLALWLKHNLPLFDQIALAKYDFDFPLPVHDEKITTVVVTSPGRATFDFFRVGKRQAMRILRTDWKVLLDIDEFLWPVPAFDELDGTKTYRLQCRALWGNIRTEIVEYGLAHASPRVHLGDVPIVRDGEAGGKRGAIIGQFWHTSGLVSQEKLFAKWAEIQRDFGSERLVKYGAFPVGEFSYENYKRAFGNAYLRTVEKSALPEVIRENYHGFDDCKLPTLRAGSFKELVLEQLRIPLYLCEKIERSIKRYVHR